MMNSKSPLVSYRTETLSRVGQPNRLEGNLITTFYAVWIAVVITVNSTQNDDDNCARIRVIDFIIQSAVLTYVLHR
jgi:hypothetical protein